MRKVCVFFLMLVANLLSAETPSDQTQATPSASVDSYVVAQSYFPKIPAEIFSAKDKVEQFINDLDVDYSIWAPWPMLVCIKIAPNGVNTPLESFFATTKKFSASTLFQVKDKKNNIQTYPGALLLESYKLFKNYDDLIAGLPEILKSPKKGKIMTVFVNFEADQKLKDEVAKQGIELHFVQIDKIEEGWSQQRKKDNVSFLRQMMFPPK